MFINVYIFLLIPSLAFSDNTTIETITDLELLSNISFISSCGNHSDPSCGLEELEESTEAIETTDSATSTSTASTTVVPVQTEVSGNGATTIAPATPLKEEQTDYCSCDISKSCDVNCCCDSDCTKIDRSVFSHCLEEVAPRHVGLCYSTQFIYSNNTRYKILENEKGYFCIARDNFPERLQFKQQKPVVSKSRFNKLWEKKKQYQWPVVSMLHVSNNKLNYSEIYKFGSTIWKYLNSSDNQFSTLDVPSTLPSGFCANKRAVQFLKNFDSKCFMRVPKSENECENQFLLNARTFCSNIVIVSLPISLNDSNIESSPEEAFINIRPIVCRAADCVESDEIPIPMYNEESRTCYNALKSVHYSFYHNGSKGLVDADCRVVITDLDSSADTFVQRYQTSFNWARNETNTFTRSGTPGYMVNRPLISGTPGDLSRTPMDKVNITLSSTMDDWLSVPAGNHKGICSRKTNILFKQNLKSQCDFQLSRDILSTESGCAKVQDQIWDLFFAGAKLNASDSSQLELFVSSYGDPFKGNSDDWVGIYFEGPVPPRTDSPCRKILTAVHYRVLYSMFGPFSRPQSKIIGVLASLQMKAPSCGKATQCSIRLVSSVNFIDVSQGAVSKFAKAPILKIRLPKDFFYPFTSSKSMKNVNFMFISPFNAIFIICFQYII